MDARPRDIIGAATLALVLVLLVVVLVAGNIPHH
jgi:hypothetical protein